MSYYNMTDSTGASGFLPTVTFTSINTSFNASDRIAQLAARGITGFYEADFANNITTIDVSAFAFDNKVVVATINQATSIRSDAFFGCTAMRSITLDTFVNSTTKKYLLTDISSGAFQGCTSLRNLHIPDTVKIIPDNMCNGCTSLEVAVMGYGCDRTGDTYNTNGTIGQSAFANCSRLSYFVVPETVSQIGDSAFANDVSLALVYILGRPDISANAFTGAMSTGATYYYDNSASYTSLSLATTNTVFPGSTKRPYREFTLTATGALTRDIVNGIIPATTYWKGKIANSVNSLATSCFAGNGSGIGIKYTYMVALSLPPALTSIGYGAFQGHDGISGYSTIIGAFYIPNSVTTLGEINSTSNTFSFYDTTLRNSSTTKQFVFQSGTNTIAFPTVTFKFSSAMAIIVPNATSFGSECFNQAKNVQLFSFFQKNAYTALTKLDHTSDDGGGNSFSNCFGALTTGTTQYLYIPKQITRISTNAFLSVIDNLIITVFCSVGDGNGGVGLFVNGNYLNSSRFTGTAPTFHLINNVFDPNGTTIGTASTTAGTYHVLFHPSIKTITNRFSSSTNLKTVTIPDTVTDLSLNAFLSCTGLTNVYISPTSNLTIIGESAINNCTSLTSLFIPNSLKRIDINAFNASTSLAKVTYGDNPGLKSIGPQAFYGTTKALTSIFIPSSVVYIGNQAFITGINTDINILNTVTFGAGSRLKSIEYRCFGHDGNNVPRAAQYLRNLVLPSSLRYMGDIANSSLLQNTHRLNNSANLIVPSSMEVIPWAFLFADNSTVDISNVYFPRSITNFAGPRVHNRYLTTGLTGAEFLASKAGSLIYLPSELSAYTSTTVGANTYPFPGTNRTRSFYKTVPFTNNPLTTLSLSGTVNNTADATNTTQIHADIKDGVTIIGGGTSIASASSGNPLNLISVNIPSTVTNISANAFNGCSALAYVTFSENSHLTTIGDSAFLNCTMIHDIQLPDTLTTIGLDAFRGCYNLASISIPYNVTSIGAGAFNVNINTPTTYIPREGGYVAYQLGSDIYGEAVEDYSGYSVSLSQDGKILAIGALYNDATGGEAGQVRVYKYQTITDATWANYTVNSFSQNGTAPFNKPIVVNGGDALPISGKYYWVQLGSDINGESGYAGWSVSLSSDGTTVAIGALVNNAAGTDSGQVRVYKYQTVTDANWPNYTINSFTYTGTAPTNKPIIVNGGDVNPVSGKFYWVQLGVDIDGVASSQSGNSVSLNSNGTVVVIGARYADIPVTNGGSVRIYQYNGSTTWNQLGSTITGGSTNLDQIGYSVAISDDGNTIAYGAPTYDTNGTNRGLVNIFKWSGTSWSQVGNTHIPGEAADDNFGESVSLSSDGTIVAIGAIGNDGGGSDSGHVRVYKYNGTTWNKLGQDIDGLAAWDHFGNSVSLSSDGTILAVGSRFSDTGTLGDTGLARIYKFCNGTWQKLGQDIRGEFVSEITGCSVSLSKDGTTVAVGAQGNDRNGNDSGMVRVYQISNFAVRLHKRLYDTISGSFSTYFPGISPGAVQVIPELQLTNTLNPSKLTISQINNMYIRYRQSQLGFCTKVTVSASSGDGTLYFSDVTNALSGTTGLVHLDISTNVTSIYQYACNANTRIYSVAISKTVTSIGMDAFINCTNLTYLSFHPDSVCTSIGQGAFLGNNIIDLALPDSLTAISSWSFQNSNCLTSVCIPKNVTSLGLAFPACPKLTSVALPASLPLATFGTGTYFSITGSTTTGITFSSYSNSGAIAHFKLSDYSMPNGIVQNVIDSAVTYIDHRAYAYYPDITLYAVTTNKQTLTAGPVNYVTNGIKMPSQPAAFIQNGSSVVSNSMFPLYRSIPDLNVFTLTNASDTWPANSDDLYILMPGYSICIYNNLYDEENLFVDTTPTYQYYDNEFGTVSLNIAVKSGTGNTASSVLIMHRGRILSKYFNS